MNFLSMLVVAVSLSLVTVNAADTPALCVTRLTVSNCTNVRSKNWTIAVPYYREDIRCVLPDMCFAGKCGHVTPITAKNTTVIGGMCRTCKFLSIFCMSCFCASQLNVDLM